MGGGVFAGIEGAGDFIGAGNALAEQGVNQSRFAHAALAQQDAGVPIQHWQQGVGILHGANGQHRVAQAFVKRQFAAPLFRFRQIGFIQHNYCADIGRFCRQQGAL